jgi:hypothetical protein
MPTVQPQVSFLCRRRLTAGIRENPQLRLIRNITPAIIFRYAHVRPSR